MRDRRDFNPDELLDRAVDAVLRDPIPDELPPDRVAQLTAVVQSAADQPCPVTIMERISRISNMNRKAMTRIAAAAAVLIAVVGLILWLGPGRGEALALTNVAEALSEVQTARWKTTAVVKWPGGEPKTIHQIGMFLAPSHERIETTVEGELSIGIDDADKDKSLVLVPAKKKATVIKLGPPPRGGSGGTFLDLRRIVLEARSGGPAIAESVGIQVIDGRRAEGFRLEQGATEMTIWADPKTALPIRVDTVVSGATEVHVVMTDFEVGVDLDPSLFSLDVPEGYTVQERQLEVPKKPIVALADTLGLVAEHNGGVFPPSLRGEHGIDGILPRIGPALEKKYGRDSPELRKAQHEMAKKTAGWGILTLLAPEYDWHYAGKDVKLNTPNRPIFWWSPPSAWDSTKSDYYEVIYADLSVQDVAPEDLPRVPEDIPEVETFQLPDADEAAFVDGMRAWLEAKQKAQAGIDRMAKKAQERGKESRAEMSTFLEKSAYDAGYPERLDTSWLVRTFVTRAITLPGLEPISDNLKEGERENLARARAREAGAAALRLIPEASRKAVGIAGFYQKLVREQREPEYFGATVQPGDSAAVLLRWKLDDGRYRVIYGDLRAETVDSRD